MHVPLRIKTCYHLVHSGLYGFDLLANRIVEPGSEVGHADFYFCGNGSFYESAMKHDGGWEKQDTFTFNDPEDGFITMKRNKESDFAFIYEAPLVGYENPVEFFLSQTDKSKRKPYPSNSTDFIVFRVSRKNEESGKLESYYGVIQSLFYSKEADSNEPFFSIEYRINTTPNDRNIEFN